jgi:hypothetical protein
MQYLQVAKYLLSKICTNKGFIVKHLPNIKGCSVQRYPLDRQRKVVAKLIEAVPELEASYKEHLTDNDELLPYVYLPDAVRDLVCQMHSKMLSDDVYDRLANAIENVLTSDPEAHDLITLGLLDEMRESELWTEVHDRLGPRTLGAATEEQ